MRIAQTGEWIARIGMDYVYWGKRVYKIGVDPDKRPYAIKNGLFKIVS